MSFPNPRRRRAAGALSLAVALALGTVACTSSDPVTDPTTTVQAGGTTETSEEPTETSRPPRTTVIEDDDEPGTTITTDRDDDDEVPTGDETAEDYADALIASYDDSSSSGDEIFGRDVVVCVSPLWVDAIGVEAFQDAGVAPADIASGSSDLDDLTLDEATAGEIVDALPGCGLPLIDLFIDGLGSSVKDSPAKVACIEGAISEAQIRTILIDQIRGAEGDDPDDLIAQCLV